MAKSNAKLLQEAEAMAGNVKKHKSITAKCTHCGEAHSASQHASHGVGSFDRSHGKGRNMLAENMAFVDADTAMELQLMGFGTGPKRKKAKKSKTR